MFKRGVLTICITAAIFASVCGCTAKSGQQLPQFVIGCDDYEPYNYTDEDGDPAGMDVELAKEACARMGCEPVFRQIGQDDRDELLNSGEIDCIWSCFSMDGREDDYNWAGPYMRSRQVAAVLADSPVTELKELEGKSIAVRTGAKSESIFLERSEPWIPAVRTVYSLNEMEELAAVLRSNYVDAIAGYAAAVREVLQKDGVDYRFLDEDLGHAFLGVAFAKDRDDGLCRELSEVLDEMLADGTTERILNSYGVNTEKALGGLGHE